MKRTTIALSLCTTFPAVGWLANTVSPAPVYGYKSELAFLVALGLVTLWLFRTNLARAIFLYFSLALIPVGMMLEHYGKGGSPLMLSPLLGIVFVTLVTRNERAIIGYGLVALVAGLAFGVLVGDVGAGVVLAFLCGGLTAGALWWNEDFNLKKELRKIQRKQENVNKGMQQIAKELG